MINLKLAISTATIALSFALPAAAVTFDLSWKGQTLGYEATGRFSYDESTVPSDGIVRSDDVDTFDISFFTPGGELFKSFTDNAQTPGFNFNFDTSTESILQTGRWDSPTGLNVGGVKGEELNMFSAGNPKADLFEDEELSPHVHLTDWVNDFPDLPIGLSRGARPHLDIAFLTRTRAEVLADPNAGDALGERLVATLASDTPTQVPEPTALLGLSVVAYGILRRQRRERVEG